MDHLPQLKKSLNDLQNMTFKGVNSEEGYLVIEEVRHDSTKSKNKKLRTYTWMARDLDDCKRECSLVLKNIISSLESRSKKINKVCYTLQQAMNFTDLITCVEGKREDNKDTPYNELRWATHGVGAFKELIYFIGQLPQFCGAKDVQISKELSATIQLKIKMFFASLI